MKFEKEKLMKMLERVKTDSTSQRLIIMVPLQFKPEIENLKKVANDCGCDIDVIGVPEEFKDDGKTIYIVPTSNNAPKIIYVIK
jgi:hypothetical protein